MRPCVSVRVCVCMCMCLCVYTSEIHVSSPPAAPVGGACVGGCCTPVVGIPAPVRELVDLCEMGVCVRKRGV